ncbi:MAG: DUF1273 family protein [Clostridia bacterium]|nr:DUF1273 family protein [Clostridia bacterium]
MVCCVTGHRPKGFPFPYYSLSNAVLQYRKRLAQRVEVLVEEGYTHFITGMAMGVDLDFAETVLALKRKYKDMRPLLLEAAIPCPEQTAKWRKEELLRYENILAACDKKTFVSPSYTPYCMKKRNAYMVDCSDTVLAVWNGEEKGGTFSTICYAKQKGKPVSFLLLQDFVNM